jgi:hypothetical protein
LPNCPIDFLYISDGEGSLGTLRDEDCIAHFSARTLVLRSYFLPKMQSTDLEFWKLLSDLAPKTLFLIFSGALPATWKHPSMVTPAAHQQKLSTL